MESLPEALGHRPAYAIPYEKFDVRDPRGTSARYLSIGIAQYSDAHVSATIFRHTGDKWPRPSEELPIHHVIEMTILASKVQRESSDIAVQVAPDTFDHQGAPMTLRSDPYRSSGGLAAYETCVEEHGPHLRERLTVFADKLSRLRDTGKL